MRRWLVALAVVGVCVVGACAGPGAALAQDAAASPIAVTLLRMSPWAGPNRDVSVTLEVRNLGYTDLQVTSVQPVLGQPLTSRSELEASVGEATTGALFLTAVPVSGVTIAPGGIEQLPVVRFKVPESIAAGRLGAVLPLELDVQGLTAADAPAAASQSLQTFVVYLSGRVADPLGLAMLVPIYEPTQRNPDGTYRDDDLAQAINPATGPLAAMAGALAAKGAPDLTLVVDALTLRDVTDMTGGYRLQSGGRTVVVSPGDPRADSARDFLASLRSAASHRGSPPVAMAYGNADLTALVDAGLDDDVTNALALGRAGVADALGVDPDRSIGWPPDGLADAQTLQVLAERGVHTVVLDPSLLPSSAPLTQNATVNLSAELGVPMTALVPDPALSAALSDPRGTSAPALWSQRVLAETAMTWLEAPESPSPRGILLAPPETWRPDAQFFADLAAGLGGAPWLDVMPASTLARAVPPGPGGVLRSLQAYPAPDTAAQLPASYLTLVKQTGRELTSFDRANAPAVARGTSPVDSAALRRNLVIAQSAAWRPPSARPLGAAYISAVTSAIGGVYNNVVVADRTITLSAHNGTIPYTILNRGTSPLRVIIQIVSGQVGFSQPTSSTVVLEPGGYTHFLSVTTRRTGVFPLTINVLTPDGRHTIATGQVTVRSTAFSRVALLLTAGAGVFLLVWWLRRWRGRRRRGTGTTPPGDATDKQGGRDRVSVSDDAGGGP